MKAGAVILWIGMRSFPACVLALFAATSVLAQTAELSGLITDPSGLAVPNARVAVQNTDTGATRSVLSNQQGEYRVPALAPGAYDITVEMTGFKTIHQDRVVVEVDQRARLDFMLTIGSNAEIVTVQASSPLLNTSDASVSTVIGNQFVDNLPLNGRSFSSLIDLAPGVVLVPDSVYEQGQFSVNGQHPDANYFMVDGVSANLGNAGSGGNQGQGGAGQLPATSAFGGTSNLVTIEALEEFRIQTSTFAPEYGRTPGAQISVVTKSGANAFHGTAFEFFRNDDLDANDWFANANHIGRPALRQNDFGGVLGAPIKTNKLFFLGSYEGLRVRQPEVANTYEPTPASRASAPAVVQPLLNAFPVPNGPDLGNGTALFTAGFSNPSTLNSYSLRIDYLLSAGITLFGRYSDAPSDIDLRSAGSLQTNFSNVLHSHYRTQSVTVGSNQSITPQVANESRFNYSRSGAGTFATLDHFGDATPPPDSALFPPGYSTQNDGFEFVGDFNPNGLRFFDGHIGSALDQQINATDNISMTSGTHQMKFGLDYRRLQPTNHPVAYELIPVFETLANVLTDTLPEAEVAARTPNVELAFSNWSIFAQDIWKATHSLTLTYGLRWEYNSPPSSPNGSLPITVIGADNPATATLAPLGTPLWKAQRDDFAPRLGMAWQVWPSLVVRAGAGIFYDLGYADIANASTAFPFVQEKIVTRTAFPLSAADAAPPPFTTSPPAVFLSVVNPNHVLPRTYEWSAAVEKSFSRSDVLTLTYLGAAGRKLMRQDIYLAPNPSVSGEFDLASNNADSSYNALQVQFRRRLSYGLQALISYTWAHAIDDDSSDVYFANVPANDAPLSQERGSSDYDIRHTLSAALTYNIPAPPRGIWKSVLGNWSTDSIVYARTAPPVNVVTGQNPFPAGGIETGAYSAVRPNLVPGAPLWIADPNVAAGRRINPAAFEAPTSAVLGDLGRNALRGFGATQVDLTLRRQFRLSERLSLQARSDFFNICNHPNFGSPINFLTSPQFGQATQMLGTSLGTGGSAGGLNPLYQIGGPRSVQIALKLVF